MLVSLIRNIRYYGIFIVLTYFHIIASGQATGDPREDFLFGEFYIEQQQYTKALPFYLSALEAYPDNSNFNYRVGQCYSTMIGQQHLALPYLEKSVKDINENYVPGKFKNTGAPIEAWLFLGDAYHRVNDLTSASYAYNIYKQMVGTSDKQRYEMIMTKIDALGVSFEQQRSEEDIRMLNLGTIINTRFSDYNPVLSGDQKIMIYTQFLESFDRIVITKRTPEGWAEPIDITAELGSQGDCYTTALSIDGKELYVVKHSTYDHDIYFSTFVDTAWTPIKPISGKINSKHRETSASISGDGQTLYFASDRPGGAGALDLYSAERKGNVWDNIQNLGNIINTEKDEDAPFISHDETILYFSSNGHLTIGNMDLLVSEVDETGLWSSPVNIGAPMNTTDDDIFYQYFNDTRTGYFSRDIPEGYGKNDIYLIQTGKDPEFIFDAGVEIKHINKDYDLLAVDSVAVYADNDVTGTVEQEMIVTEPVNSEAAVALAVNPDDIVPEAVEPKEIVSESVDSEAAVAVIVNPDIIVPEAVEPKEIVSESGDSGVVNSEESYQVIEKKNYEDSLISIAFDTLGGLLTEDIDFDTELDSLPTYTIQIMALKNPVDKGYFKIQPVVVSSGDDGLYRYTYGEYKGWTTALTTLENIRNNGFADAFIRNIISVQNYGNIER
ncbi:MAG: PD40 domain-containing protein [Bacteroidales bacterium]|nr:PD40 domain-containing protein [Bacteroidales bacterium]